MYNRKLSEADFGHRLVSERFSHLQHVAGLSEQGKGRVEEAMKAAVAHVEKKMGLQYGMQGKHVDMVLDFLDKHYDGRYELLPKERKVIEQSFKSHFEIQDTSPRIEPKLPETQPETANNENYQRPPR